jgi:DNA ligase D
MAGVVSEVDADGIAVRVSSADRVIFPATERTPEFTKKQVVEYFVAVADGIIPALQDRPVALERWPKGVQPGFTLGTGHGDRAEAFYQKRVPQGAPEYVESTEVTFPSGRTAREVCVRNLATIAWCAQMGALTFHPWATRASDNDHPDELRIDLDPHEGTDFADALRVALLTREVLEGLGLRGFAKTSGNRGIHVYVRIQPNWTFEEVRHAAIGLGRELERRDPGVTTAWWKELRGPRIFVDYNQNNRDRTIASAYSLRARPGAPVSTPLSWEQLAEVKDPREFNLATVPQLVADGDPWADLDSTSYSLEPLLELWEELPGGELNFPPDYPKMPGEPPRVQPSRKKAR